MNPKDKVHWHVFNTCFTFHDMPLDTTSCITVSKDIETVTCPQCVYYYFNPEARRLEAEFRRVRGL